MLRLASLRRLLSLTAGCVFVAACGPEGATPVPEPPALQADKLFVPVSVASPYGASLDGSPGAAPARALVEVTALDSTEPPVATTAAEDGSFSVSVLPAGELRAVAIVLGRRSQPLDFSVVANQVAKTPRPDCLRVAPALLTSAPRGGTARFTITNACTAPVTLGNARTRTASPNFAYDSAFKATMPVNGSATISVTVAPSAALTDQEVLFIDADVDGTLFRYPLGVYVSE